MNQPSIPSPSTRGPADHDIRNQIVAAANEHFSQYGYGKTTVSDLAKAIGFSKAYIYKFFDSKQAIGEAICSQCLAEIVAAVEQAISEDGLSATERFRRLVKALITTGVNLFFNDRKLYDIAAFPRLSNGPVRKSITLGSRASCCKSCARDGSWASSNARRHWTKP